MRLPNRPGRALSMLVLLGAACGVAGCTKWVKPGATEYERQATEARCDAIAHSSAPPAPYTVMTNAAYWTPKERRCRTDSNGRETCTTTGGEYRPATFSQRDANRGQRDAIFRDCMFSQGWRPE